MPEPRSAPGRRTVGTRDQRFQDQALQRLEGLGVPEEVRDADQEVAEKTLDLFGRAAQLAMVSSAESSW